VSTGLPTEEEMSAVAPVERRAEEEPHEPEEASTGSPAEEEGLAAVAPAKRRAEDEPREPEDSENSEPEDSE